LEDTDVTAYQRAAGTAGDDPTDILINGVDFTLTGAGVSGGGTMTLTVGATTGDFITVLGDDPIERTSYYTTNPTIDAFNEDFEKQTIFNLLNETLRGERMLSYQNSETVADKDRGLPILDPNNCWRMNDGGTALVQYELVDTSTAAPRRSTYITQTLDSALTNSQALGDLASGILKSATGTGIVSIAAAGTDYLTDIVQDTTPQLGGNLDLNSKNVTGTGAWQGTIVTQSYGGTGIDSSGATDGQLLVGGTSSNDFQLAELTATADQTTVTNGTNTITVGVVQDIAAASSPTFTGLTLSGLAVDEMVKTVSGVLSAATAGSDYLTDVVQDTTPQLGGNLDLNSSDITGTGEWQGTIVAQNYGGTGIDSSAVTNGQVLVGGTTLNDFQLSTLTGTANQLNVTNGVNSITFSTPQDIAAASSPTFTGLTLSGLVTDGVVKTASGILGSEAQLILDDGGTGIDASAVTDGQLYVGGTASNDMQLAALTGTANQIAVTNGTNSVTLATPQDIAAASSPTFTGMTLSGLAVDGFVTTTSGVLGSIAGSLDASDITIDNLAGATYTDVQDVIDFFGSAGYIEGGAITDNVDGTVDIDAGEGFVRTTDSATGRLITFEWPATPGLTMTDGAETYIYVDYNAGTPQVVLTGSSSNLDYNTEFELYEVVREGTVLHIADHQQKMINIPGMLQQYLYSKNKIERADAEGGLILGSSLDTNRWVLMSAGRAWIKLDPLVMTSKDTDPGGGGDTFDSYLRDGGVGWNKSTGGTRWSNLYFDNDTGGTTTLTPNRYASQYFYIDADDELVHLYGQAQHVTLAGALDEAPPASVPPRLESHSLLIGRIVFQRDDTVPLQIDSAFDTAFAASNVTDHVNLAGLTTTDAGHTQFALLTGRAGGQTLIGGTGANDDMTLETTSHGTKGDYIFTELTTNGVAKIDGSGLLTVSAQLELADGGTEIDASGATDGQLLVGGTASNDLQLATLTAGAGIGIVNGTNAVTISATGGGEGWVFLNSQTASNSASIVFDNTYITDTYDAYKLLIFYTQQTTDNAGVHLGLQTSTDNASSWSTGGADYDKYTWKVPGDSGGTAAYVDLFFDVGGGGGLDLLSGEIIIIRPTNASYRTRVQGQIMGTIKTGGGAIVHSFAERANAEDNDAIRIIMSANNIDEGQFVLYGLTTS
jgi:hypothetical protein